MSKYSVQDIEIFWEAINSLYAKTCNCHWSHRYVAVFIVPILLCDFSILIHDVHLLLHTSRNCTSHQKHAVYFQDPLNLLSWKDFSLLLAISPMTLKASSLVTLGSPDPSWCLWAQWGPQWGRPWATQGHCLSHSFLLPWSSFPSVDQKVHPKLNWCLWGTPRTLQQDESGDAAGLMDLCWTFAW